MRSLVLGFLAGQALAALCAPLGVDLFQLPAVAASTAYGYRAGALATVGLGLLAAGRLVRPAAGLLVLGAALGFLHRGLLFEADAAGVAALVGGAVALFSLAGLRLPRGERARGPLRGALVGALAAVLALWSQATRPSAALGYGVVLFAALVALGRSGWLFPGERRGADAGAGPALPPRGEASGLALAGAGAAIALEGLARHLRLLGGGTAADDALFGALFLGLAAVGAGAFRQALARTEARQAARGPLLAATAVAAFAGLRAVASLATPAGLERYLRGLRGWFPDSGLDPSLVGTWSYDLAIGLPVLALPAVLLGAAVRALRGPVELGAALIGAAAGHVLVPALMAVELDGTRIASGGSSAALIATGAKLAALGALAAVALGAARGRRAGLGAAATTLALGAAAFVLAAPQVLVTAPWQRRPAAPRLAVETPEGLLTIEDTGSGIEVLTLDRRALAPPLAAAALDRIELEQALRLLPDGAGPEGRPRVLLVGQLTPGRAFALEGLSVARVDRTGAWHALMPALEAELFGPQPLPAGDVLAPAEASLRMARGDYELVLVPSTPGDAPALHLGFPVGPDGAPASATRVVVWLDTRAPIAALDLGQRVVPATADLEELAVAVTYGGDPARLDGGLPGAPRAVPAGRPTARPDPLDRLALRPEEALRENRRELARRLAGATEGGPDGRLWHALAVLSAAQRRSSVFETPAERFELDEQALVLVRDAALAGGEPDAFFRQVLETLAVVLRGKRAVEEIGAYLGPIAARFYPWTALENALAYAEIELLDPQAAAARMQRLAQVGAADATSRRLQGEAESQAGDPVAACEAFWEALEAAPRDRGLRRRLAIELARAGDPESAPMLSDLLLEDPDDEELRLYLGSGPFPPPPAGFPTGRHEVHDH